MVKKKAAIFFGFILFLYFFVVYDVSFYGPDAPIYFAYTSSIIDDGDLNVVNQCYPPFQKINISKTHNLPDFHNHGGIIFWSPFYVYGKIISYIAGNFNFFKINYDSETIFMGVMAFSTIAFGFFALIFTYLLCRAFFSFRVSVFSTAMIFLGTPLFYFLLFDTANANVIAFLFSVISIWFCNYVAERGKMSWLIYGLFFSVGTAVKVDLWFQLFFIFLFFIILLRRKQTTVMSGICFLAGLLPVAILKIINDYIKYGIFHLGEVSPVSFKYFYFFEQLFSSYHGFFYTSPIFYVCALGGAFMIGNLIKTIILRGRKSRDQQSISDLFFLSLAGYLFLKVLLISWNYAWGGGTPGARVLLTELPIFVLLYARAFQMKSKIGKYLLGAISVVCVVWNLLIISEFMTKLDLRYIVQGFPNLWERLKVLKVILVPLFFIKALPLKLKSCLPLVILVFLLFRYTINRAFLNPVSFWPAKDSNCGKPLKFFSIFTIYLCSAYTIVTLLNIVNNSRNADNLKNSGFFKNAEIVDSRYFEERENVGSLYEMAWYFKAIGKNDKAAEIKKHIREIYDGKR